MAFLDGGRDFPWGPKEGFPWSKRWRVTESVCHEGLFLLSVTVQGLFLMKGNKAVSWRKCGDLCEDRHR